MRPLADAAKIVHCVAKAATTNWDDVPEPMPDWDLLKQPEPDFEFDQHLSW
jgi:hypothetical protein